MELLFFFDLAVFVDVLIMKNAINIPSCHDSSICVSFR